MGAPCIILASLPSFCQSKLVEIWRSSCKNNFAQFFWDTVYKQGIHRLLTPPRCHNATSATSKVGLPGSLWPNVMSSIKLEVHNVSQRCQRIIWAMLSDIKLHYLYLYQRRTEPWRQGIRTQIFVMISPAVPEICSQTDRQTHRQTDRQTDHSTLLPYRGGARNPNSLLTVCSSVIWTARCLFVLRCLPLSSNSQQLTCSKPQAGLSCLSSVITTTQALHPFTHHDSQSSYSTSYYLTHSRILTWSKSLRDKWLQQTVLLAVTFVF